MVLGRPGDSRIKVPDEEKEKKQSKPRKVDHRLARIETTKSPSPTVRQKALLKLGQKVCESINNRVTEGRLIVP